MTSAYQSRAAESRACFPHVSHGETQQAEQRVMDLWDAGMSIRQIARHLGRPAPYVSKIVFRFVPSPSDRAISPAAIARGSRRLLAALRRHHPERICD